MGRVIRTCTVFSAAPLFRACTCAFSYTAMFPSIAHTYIHTYMRAPLGKHMHRLEKYTFPTEKKFAEAGFALQKYKQQVRRHIINGTTTCCYYATIHLEASLILAKVRCRHRCDATGMDCAWCVSTC